MPPPYEWEEFSYQTVIKNEVERTAVTILKINLLNLRNYFVIFCNFPIDEMPFMGYNTAMKKMLVTKPTVRRPRSFVQPGQRADSTFKIVNIISLGG